jgi:hypothetical protein
VELLQLMFEAEEHFPVPRQEVRAPMYAVEEVPRVQFGELVNNAG